MTGRADADGPGGADGLGGTGAGRRIRSYVLREGRLTAGQQRALQELWPKYGVDLPAGGDDDGDAGPDTAGRAPAERQNSAPLSGPMSGPIAAPVLGAIFHRTAPLHLEIGFGDGEALLEMAAQNPHCDFLGAEVHGPGVGRALLQIEARQLANIRLFRADGMRVLSALAPRSLAALHLYFPDPWPKKRHHKRRLMQPPFIALAASRLADGGQLRFATDWRDYAEEALARLEEFGELENCAGRGQFAPRPAARPQTKFERRGRRLGHPVWDIVMQKAGEKAGD